MGKNNTVKVKCFRFDPKKDRSPHYDTYEVSLGGAMSVQDCLLYIRRNLDPSLAFFVNCRLGFCKRCVLRVNGKSCFACMSEVKGDILVEPVKKNQVIRDLWSKGT